ncbi:MAG: rod shape-determining protein MreD [Acidithiobacillales bacterium SM1_46]|jgi:rod shape-determining protein MreD|nr:MAG: rod shape-determining protein MreD [Acidithiobacillales bacterium SM1_46]
MTLSPQTKARLALVSTFLVAIVLSIMPGPTWAEPFRPDWVGLVLVYWCIAAPGRVGVGTGFVLGLAMDVLYGALLGSNALVKSLLAFLANRMHLRMRMFPRWQQAVAVMLLLALDQLLVLWIRGAAGRAPETLFYWTPSVVGMVIWPWLFVILRDVRRRAKIA